MAVKAGPPRTRTVNTTDATTNKGRNQDPNRAVLTAEDQLRNLLNKAEAAFASSTFNSIKSLQSLTKAVEKVTRQFAVLERTRQVTPSARNLTLDPGLQKRVTGIAGRALIARSLMVSEKAAEDKEKRLDQLAQRFEKEKVRRESRLNRLRSQYSSMGAKWLQEDRAGATEPLSSVGKTTPLGKPLSRAQLNKIGKVTSPLIGDVITESLAIAGNTTLLNKPLSRAQLNKVGKVTAPLISGAITESLSLAGRTIPMKPFPFIPITPGRPTTPLGGRPTTAIGGGKTQRYASYGGQGITTYMNGKFPHPAGMLPPLEEEGGGGGGSNWLMDAIELFSGYELAKWGRKKLYAGRDWDLKQAQYAQNLTTNLPQFALSGGGVSGLKSTTGGFGGSRASMGPMGPVTIHEVMGLMHDKDIQASMIMGGVPIKDWMKVISSFGTRKNLQQGIGMAAAAFHDNDLAFKTMEEWVSSIGTLTQRGYNIKQVGQYLGGMRGALQVGGANGLSKGFISSEIEDARESLAARGNVDVTNLPGYMGSYMGGTALPSMRTPGFWAGALGAAQGAEGGTIGNPYLFTVMAREIAKKGGSLEGAFGDLGAYSPMMKDIKNLPMSQQIAIATQMKALSPEKMVGGVTDYFKSLGGNKAVMMQAAINTLNSGGIDVDDHLKDLIYSDFYGTRVGAKPTALEGADTSMLKPGDLDRLRGSKAREGAGVVAEGVAALELSKSVSGLSNVEAGLAGEVGKLTKVMSDLIDRIPLIGPMIHHPSTRPK